MSSAHWHLVLSHIPILGVPAGLALLIWGMFKKSADLRAAALVAFLICGVCAFTTKQTGEGAEEQVENLPGYSKSIRHEHEEMGEKATVATSILAVLSLLALVASSRGKELPKATSLLLATLALVSGGLLFYTGALGGQIRHTEIRGETLSPNVPVASSEKEEREDRD